MGRLLRIALTALLVSGFSSQAQEPSGRIDLEAMAARPEPVAARVVFTKSSAVCPDDHSILQISGKLLLNYRVETARRTAPFIQFFTAMDDKTYLYRVATPECRIELAIRQQVRQEDGFWQSLSVTRARRPSLSREEREEAIREQQRERPPVSPQEAERRAGADKARRSFGSLWQGVASVMSGAAVFERAPAACMEAFGTLAIDQDGVTFTFVTGMPGEVNRFVIERTDIDDDHSRLYFMRADCRYEITIGASDFTNGAWVARPVAPYAPAKARIFIQKNPDTRPSWLDRSD